jgi:predicted nucleic acid-binding protein
MKILIDANVALDVLLERQPFYVSGIQILGLSKGGIELYISASAITDLYYIIKKELKSKETSMLLIKNLIISVDIAAVSGSEIRRAIDLDWGDFEDAVQFATGESIAVDYLVTRNTSDFASITTLPVVTPDELLRLVAGTKSNEKGEQYV